MKFLRNLLFFAMLSINGCDSSPRLVPVSGTITVKGKPAEGAILMFHPAEPKNATGSAVAEADGNFTVVSGGEPGLVQGKYQITVIWPDPSKKPTQAQIMMGTAEPGPDLLKDKYSSKDSSSLSAEITSSSTKLAPLEL